MTDVFTEIEQAVVSEVQAAEAAIKQWWTTEEPIVVGELKTAAQQLASIVVAGLTTVLEGVANGTVKNTEAFGTLVTNAYQTAISTGLNVGITDVEQAAAQAVASAKTLVSAPAAPATPAA